MSVYAVSDLHGNGTLWSAIKDFLKPEDTLYFLGDAADRGPDGWRILKEALADPRVIYIAGNHDVMLADRIARPGSFNAVSLHWQNGGEPTWDACENDPEVKEIMLKIRKLPKWVEYVNKDGLTIFMSHSGCTNKNDEYDLVWDRSEFFSGSRPEGIDIIVHGHTPIPYLIHELAKANKFLENTKYDIPPDGEDIEPGAFWYNGCRIDIDCCTITTGMTVLLDLDTFDEQIFQI